MELLRWQSDNEAGDEGDDAKASAAARNADRHRDSILACGRCPERRRRAPCRAPTSTAGARPAEVVDALQRRPVSTS